MSAPVQFLPASGPVALFAKPQKPEVARLAPQLVAWLHQRGHTVLLDEETAAALGQPHFQTHWEHVAPRLAIVLGGDGTLLRVARLLRAAGAFATPLLGINLGTLGFLAEVSIPDIYRNLEAVFSQDCHCDVRTVLTTEVWRDSQSIARMDALNDVVVSKGAMARIIEFDVHIDQAIVAHYRADGLIVATPTGSTAYSLSAGGPVLHPSVDAFVINPICPHALTNRPLIVKDSALVAIHMLKTVEPTYLTADGQSGLALQPGDRVLCRKSEHTATLVRLPERSFFDVLRTKLKWG